MTLIADNLQPAIETRLRRYREDVVFHSILGLLATALGSAMFFYLWSEYGDDEGVFVKQLAVTASGLVTFGAGGCLCYTLLSLRDKIRTAKDWLKIYAQAFGPPPSSNLPQVQTKTLSLIATGGLPSG